ncbi:unnamed protein product [Ilex paraguariensis]|uniref:Uncharacterized protein n=1 Tax=Ilex paraguariensis TaxID=185542 RepID=A0ABC8U818_9AQUA
MVSNDSLDYPFLVANDTYTFTAKHCVMCKCDAANNWALQCESSQINSSKSSCPSMQCQGADNLYLGNTTSSTCNRTLCAYAGYKDQIILTSLAVDSTSTCPAPHNNSPKASLQGWRWNIVLIATHLVVLGIHLFH